MQKNSKVIYPEKREYHWSDGKKLVLGEKTLIMGILNVTPDSFSDGGKYNTIDKAIEHMLQLVAEGADIIDIGAESSRPGFKTMSAKDEMTRLRPFLEALVPACPVPISIDTFKSETADMAASMGVHILNDIWGLQYAEEEPGAMARVAAKYDIPVVAMHNQNSKEYQGDKLILDPGIGIGFGKTVEGNLEVMNRLQQLKRYNGKNYPILLGTSRKSFIGLTLDLPVEERMEPTGATCVLGITKGCEIMRVHDVLPIRRMCQITDAILAMPSCKEV